MQVRGASAGGCHLCRGAHKSDGSQAVEQVGHACIWGLAGVWWNLWPTQPSRQRLILQPPAAACTASAALP